MASFGFGPGNPARRYPRVCRLFGNAIPFRHARQPIYPIHTHTYTHSSAHTFTHIHQYAGDESRVCLLAEATNKSYIFLPLRWVGFWKIFGRQTDLLTLTHTHTCTAQQDCRVLLPFLCEAHT